MVGRPNSVSIHITRATSVHSMTSLLEPSGITWFLTPGLWMMISGLGGQPGFNFRMRDHRLLNDI